MSKLLKLARESMAWEDSIVAESDDIFTYMFHVIDTLRSISLFYMKKKGMFVMHLYKYKTTQLIKNPAGFEIDSEMHNLLVELFDEIKNNKDIRMVEL